MPWMCDRRGCEYQGADNVLFCPVCGCHRLHYHPTTDEIAEECSRIQATWTPRQERSRRVAVVLVYEFPLIVDTWRRSWESEVI